MPVNAQTFIKIWRAAESLEEVAEKTGTTIESASTRAARYRKRGIQLKRFQRGRKPLEVVLRIRS